MLTKFRILASLYRQAGFRWSAFRVAYAFRLRTGLVRLQIPQYEWKDRPLESWLGKDIPTTAELYAQWRRQNSPAFFFDQALFFVDAPWNKQTCIDEAEKILNGEIKYFSNEFYKTGFPPDWHKDPVSGIKIDSNKHWSQLSDDGGVDIKFIWEASRFSMVYTLVRAFAATQDEKYADAFWTLVLDWADHNQPNSGPNWMDGQEISLRLMAWTFGFYAFLNSPSTTSERITQFTNFVAAQAQRIYQNIDYAVSTQSNHTISEACGLLLVGILFPELKDSKKYLSLGRKLLEEQAMKQIYPDGSYSMYSINYHRFVLQIYFYAMRLGEVNGSRLSESVYQAVASSVEYLYQLIDPQTGQMPVYGSNDGALVLSLNNCDFTDYRPLLQLGSFIATGKRLFEFGSWDEDLYWLCGSHSLHTDAASPKQSNQSFSNGGTYIVRNSHSKAVIRCTDYPSRPSHADQLHVDLWWQDKNIACDAGTYLYSGTGIWRNGLAHTGVHNTVVVDSKDQMNMVSRFTWTDWAQGKVLTQKGKLWQGGHDGYSHLSSRVTHIRTVEMLENDRWLIIDKLNGAQPHHYSLHWLLNDFPFIQKENAIYLWPDSDKYMIRMGLLEGKSKFSIVRGDPHSTRGWRSRYYGHKEPAISAMLETDRPSACFWTFFGFEADSLELTGAVMKINSQTVKLD